MTKPIEHKFYLPSQYVEAHLSKYYILHWQGDYLVRMLDQSPTPYLLHQGILYRTSLLNDLGILDPSDLDPAAQYKISFRLEKFMHQGIALLKLANPANPANLNSPSTNKVSYEHHR